MVPGLAPSGRRSASEVISAVRKSCQPNHITPIVAPIALRHAISAIVILHVQWHGADYSSDFREVFCLRSKGLTCLETSPGLGSPWVPLSTGESQSQPHISRVLQTAPMLLPDIIPRSPPLPPLQWPPCPSPFPPQRTTNSHLLMLLAKLRTGTTGRATTARLATEETARRANILAGGAAGGRVECRGYMRANAVF